MAREILHIDELASRCGFFTSETDANNGYGCNHPDNEEYEMLWKDEFGYTHRGSKNDGENPKTKQGKCFDFSCPIASRCFGDDARELGLEVEGIEDDDVVDDYVIFDEENLKELSKENF